MIRLSVNNDKDGIVSLWQEAFGDGKDEITFFLNKRYKPENTLIYEINGETASMLFLLDGDMCIKGIDYPSYYLYAACTAKKYRGQGLMAELLSFAKETAISRNKYFICLMPAEKSLFDFYEKHGYKAVFKKKVITVNKDEFLNSHIAAYTLDIPFESLAEIRNKAFNSVDYFKWDNEAVNFAFNHNSFYNGEYFLNPEGYFLYTENKDSLTVKENAFTSETFEKFLTLITQKHKKEKYIINVPVGYETAIGSAEIAPSAMMLALNKNADNLMNEIKNAYLGLTLD